MTRGRKEYEVDEDERYDPIEEDDQDSGGKTKRKRGGAKRNFVDDYAVEEDDDGDYRGGGGGSRRGKKQRKGLSNFFELEAQVDSDDEEEDEEGDDDFIDTGVDIPDEDDRRVHRRPLLPREDDQEEDVEEIEKRIHGRYAARNHNVEYVEEATDVEQQALLPSITDPKLWMVKCAIGREREVAVCLMQKCIDKGSEIQIRSVVALDYFKNYVYIEADKEAHVREVVKGMRNIYPGKIMLVPIKEMTDVLSVESKAVDVSRDAWVRMKIGIYKEDLAKVVEVDNVRRRATVKLVPRIDFQAMASKLEGKKAPKEKGFTQPARLINIDEARLLNIRVERKRDPSTGDYYDKIEGMTFKDGFLYKPVSLKSLRSQNVQPTFDELEKFRGDGEMSGLTMPFANRKKGDFMKGDRVIIIKGDLRNLKGWVEKVEEDTLHIRPNEKGLPKTLAVSDKEVCKYFEPGNHVKVVSEGTTGLVVSVEGHVVNIVSDTTKEHLRVFADNVVESSEVTPGVTRIGGYELHDCIKARSCMMMGGSREVGRNVNSLNSRFSNVRTPTCVPESPMRQPRGGSVNFGGRHIGGRGGHGALVGATVKIRIGHYKGCKGRVRDVKGSTFRVELESQMKVVEVDRSQISDNVDVSASQRRSETPMHPSRTPLRPMRYSYATRHDGMRTPMHNRAWNPYAQMSPT